MLYIIGLGLNERGISLEGIDLLKKCRKIFLEGYTVDFPYNIKELDKLTQNKIIPITRKEVESDLIIEESKKQDIALLVYGSPLFATTHLSLIDECKEKKIKFKIIYSSSVFGALAETGLQLYKFGKISSMPQWQENYKPDSFLDYVIENRTIEAHSLILIDIGLKLEQALIQLEEASKSRNFQIDKIVVCSSLGNKNSKILYGKIENLKNKSIKNPFCFIIPSKMHFLEEEFLNSFLTSS